MEKNADIEERVRMEAEDERSRRPYRVFVTRTTYGYIDVHARTPEHAESIAEDAEEDEFEWLDSSFEYSCEEY